MNHLRLLLVLSVALNVGIGTLLVLQTASRPMPKGAREQENPPLFAGAADSRTPTAAQSAPPASSSATTRAYRRLLGALRATGLPEEEVHRILRGAALADWLEDVRLLQENRTGQDAFWKAKASPSGIDVANQRKIVELRRIREAALAELIGEDESFGFWNIAVQTPRRGIPPEKRRAVIMVEEDYELLRAEMYARTGSPLSAEDREALRLLQQERREDLERILSPEELEEYQLRHSETAERLRAELASFQPAEEEFRELFRLRHALETEFPSETTSAEERDVAEEAMQEELRTLLGEERFADYLRTQDPDYQQLGRVTEQLGISPQRASEVYHFKALIEEQHREIVADPDLTPEDRAEAIQLLAAEARDVVREKLGQRGYDAYLENGGLWLQHLQKTSAPGDDGDGSP